MLDFQNMLHVLLLHKHSCCGGKKIKKKKKERVVLWFQRTYMVSFTGPITYFSA